MTDYLSRQMNSEIEETLLNDSELYVLDPDQCKNPALFENALARIVGEAELYSSSDHSGAVLMRIDQVATYCVGCQNKPYCAL
jgi:hypothetical protein